MNQTLKTNRVIVVEGKYDVARLTTLVDAAIVTTDGFAIFKNREQQQLLRQLAKANGLLLLTDSDQAGFQIRTFLRNLVGEENVLECYIPALSGKEKRKAQPGKEGLLGVEGVPSDLLRKALQAALAQDEKKNLSQQQTGARAITYTDLYEWGLSGVPGGQQRKRALLKALGLPPRLSKKQLVEVLNRLYTWQEISDILHTLTV